MEYKFRNIVIIGLGGSIINPREVNVKFLKHFKKFIAKWAKQNKKFIIVAGGGGVAREYQNAGGKVVGLSDEDKDWIGIHATRLNAHLLRTIFRKEADPIVIDSQLKSKAKRGSLEYPVTIASGWRPGWSTDYIALQLAKDFEVGEAIIAGKPDFVYTKNPDKNKRARALENLSWKAYRKIIPARWVPGAHSPVDPVAAKLAERENLKAIIMRGTNLYNFNNLLAGKKFIGTIIK